MTSPDLYIPTIADLERVIDENPDVRESLRRKLLTDEERQLPQLVAQLTEQVNKLAQTVADGFSQAATDRAAIRQEMAEGFAQVDRRFNQMDERFNRLEGRVDNALGSNYENKIADNINSIAGQALDIRNIRALKRPGQAPDRDLEESSYQAQDENRITRSENVALWALDLIFTGHRHPSRETVYVAAEISITAGVADISRAAERATILSTVLENATVIPAVIAENVALDQLNLAETQGVSIILRPAT